MQVVAKATLRDFWEKHPKAEIPLKAWFAVASHSSWTTPADIKRVFGSNVDFVGDSRAIFDIGGNKYRLIVHVAYRHRRMLIKLLAPMPSMTGSTRRPSDGKHSSHS